MISFGDKAPALIRTKLQRPRLGDDLVPRPHLIEILDQGVDHKLTLISALAGAGKTTLLAQWLADCPWPSTWLSLDSHDNNLMLFVSYLCAAVQDVFPDACEAVLDLLQAPTEPPPRVIITALVNELDVLFGGRNASGVAVNGEEDLAGPQLILVLDDYHSIVEPAIHGMLSDLIAYLPRGLHLALTTRTDPPLPLAGLRARDEMTELRTADLHFNSAEAGQLLHLTLGREVSRETVDLLTNRTEGWIVGLRLAALTVRNRSSAKPFARKFEGASSHIIVDYLVSEVLSEQTPDHQDFLLRSAIFERFNAELCDAVLWPEDELASPGFVPSHAILTELGMANLFLIPLDEKDHWFRYHHLFREFLLHQLGRRLDRHEIHTLHGRASRWFEEHGLTEEALNHAFSASRLDRAADIVSRRRYSLMNQARWQQLDRYLSRFPAQYADQQPKLLMLKSWLVHHQGHYEQLPAILRQLEGVLDQAPLSLDEKRHLQGEMSALKSMLYYYQTNVERTMAEAEFSIQNTPPELWIVRILARLLLAGAYLMKGDLTRPFEIIYRGADEEVVQSNFYRSTMLITICDLNWVMADMHGLRDRAQQSLELHDRSSAVEIAGYAHYHLGCANYHLDELAAAEEHFATVVRRPYLNYGDCFAHSAFGLSLIYRAQGRKVEAKETAALAVAHMIETGNTTLLPVALALQAELALRQGKLATAVQWADQFETIPSLSPMIRFYQPHFTLVKIWIAQDTPAARNKAAESLAHLKDFAESTHSRIVLLKTLSMLAILNRAEGNEPAALALLTQALELAEPGGIIRLFVDLGQSMFALIQALQSQDQGTNHRTRHLDKIVAAFPESALRQRHAGASIRLVATQPLVDPLTPREIEVLQLLSQRLSNKEIARKLVVSPDTVKSHTLSIYGKLDVHGRRQAVDKARAIGLLLSS